MRQGYVYKIIHMSEETLLPYIGSTWTSLSGRMSQHRNLFNKWKEGKGGECAIYRYFDDYGMDFFEIIELERYEVEDRQQLRKYEQEWIEKLECCNKVRAVMRPKNIHDAEYYQKNAEKIKENVREYRLKNLDVIVQRKKEWEERNKERLREQRKQKVRCDTCNMDIRKGGIPRHEKSKRHQDSLASQ